MLEVMVTPEQSPQARALKPIHERQVSRAQHPLFDPFERQQLARLARANPSLADLLLP